MRTHASLLALSVVTLASPLARASSSCPAAVTAAVTKSHPDATISACKKEVENGKTQFEVKIAAKDGAKLELDVSPEGAILQTEEVVGLDTLPAAVTAAFGKKYPGMKATRAEKQTTADGKVTWELAFKNAGKRNEATFADDGTFVEEE